MNKALGLVSLLTAMSLAACGGGGSGSSSPSVPAVVFPMSGAYAGPLNYQNGGIGKMALIVTTNGSSAYGDFGLQSPTSNTPLIVNFSQSNAVVSGNNLSINAILTLANAPAGYACPFVLNATMIGANEIKGSYTTGDGKADCGGATQTTETFDLTRQQLQDAERQVQGVHAAGQ